MDCDDSKNANNDESDVTANETENETVNNVADLFLEQIMFSKYFLMNLGFNICNEVISNLTHKDVENVSDYFLNYDKFDGLRKRDVIFKDSKESINMMNNFVLCVMSMIKNKVVIQDSFLILCFEYCNQLYKQTNDNKLLNKLVDCFYNCFKQCLTGKNEKYYIYFKEYLLFSNILYQPIIFDNVNKLVNGELMKQKQFIWDSIKIEEKNDNENWNKLIKFGNNSGTQTVRQDKIKNGIKSDKTENDLYLIAATIEDDNDVKSDYDVKAEFKNKVYITKCLTFAHQSSGKFINVLKSFSWNGELHAAPVKKFDRCLVKVK